MNKFIDKYPQLVTLAIGDIIQITNPLEFDYTPRKTTDYVAGDVGVIQHIFYGNTLCTVSIQGKEFYTVYKEEFIVLKKGNNNEKL